MSVVQVFLGRPRDLLPSIFPSISSVVVVLSYPVYLKLRISLVVQTFILVAGSLLVFTVYFLSK